MLASNAVRDAYTELLPVFEKATGHNVLVEWGGTPDIVRRVAAGEALDIVVIPASRVDELVARGKAVERIDRRGEVIHRCRGEGQPPAAGRHDDCRSQADSVDRSDHRPFVGAQR